MALPFLTQPLGGDQVADYTWGQVLDSSRRMAAHLRSLGMPPGSRVAMLAKNSAHFFMVDPAVRMAGHVAVAIFSTETADNIRFVLDHSEASLLFVGKLDAWEHQRGAVPAGRPCIALPLAHCYVGKPGDDVQVRVAEDGEILIKSPGTMMGYYKQPELNAEAFTADGFFHAGDLGEYDAEGRLKLTGCKKELFTTAKGKYVAPAPIENRLNAHAMVELSIVSGVGQPAACAVVVLDELLRPRTADPEVRARVEAVPV